MRPKAIRQAEGVYLASIGMMLAASAVQWPALRAAVGAGPLLTATAVAVGLWAGLLLFATRGRANWARWGLVLLTAFAVLSILWQAAHGQIVLATVGLLNIAQAVATAIGAVLLFRPETRAWFTRAPVEDDR